MLPDEITPVFLPSLHGMNCASAQRLPGQCERPFRLEK